MLLIQICSLKKNGFINENSGAKVPPSCLPILQ
nr:MAG TPA: hypothetical protein [Caudoviricetes sp.]